MSIYTISPDLLRNIDKDNGIYFTDILFVFAQRANSFKVAKDKNGCVLKTYEDIEENGEIIKTWLDLMSFSPSPFETIDVDVTAIDCEETRFVKVCKETKGQRKLILYTAQNLKEHDSIDGCIIYENCEISILDRDEARIELNTQNKFTVKEMYIGSQVARENSQIIKSKNYQNGE